MSDHSPQAILRIVRLKPLRSLGLSGLLCVAWVAAWWFAATTAGRIPLPFVFWDVALVAVLCGIPVGLVIAEPLLRISRMLGIVLSSLGLALGGLLFLDLSELATLGSPGFARWFWGGLVGLCFAILAGAASLFEDSRKLTNWPLWSLVFLIPLMSIASLTYSADRARYHEKTVQKYLSQSRWQEAKDHVLKLQALDPRRKIKDRRLSEWAADLNREVKLLRDDVARIQAELANADGHDDVKARDSRIRLAEDWAMLGEPENAVEVLSPLADVPNPSPIANNLLGTIYEHQEHWSESLRRYELARDGLLKESSFPESHAELVRAWKGIAYAHRNQSRPREAEAAYQKVLEKEPTAENHYLMAQFYENAQQGDKAQEHAYRAAELDPLFREKADQLVRDLEGNQFGCFGVFRSRRNLLSR